MPEREKPRGCMEKRMAPSSGRLSLAASQVEFPPVLQERYTTIFLPVPMKVSNMGFLMSKSMDANLQKQQEFMLHNSRLQMERQILMQNQMRERQMAMQIAWSREFLKYFGSFFAVATLGLTAGAIKRKQPGMLAPIVPLGFVFAYQMDSAYGTLIYRMRGEAENIMASEHDRLDLPLGTPTYESIEKARRAKTGLISFLEK
ncbi:plasminogen receptor (KT) isoform X2 [Poecilia latipinna]|nr:PREDICTED: plasminogen receptor (KT) isoform X2 [Poecilia latipinna]